MDSNEQIVYHIPALASQSIEGLNINPAGTYVDVTFGGGGHSRLIINSLGNDGRLFGFDQDMDAYANRIDDARFTFVHGNFRYLENFLRYYGVKQVDGISSFRRWRARLFVSLCRCAPGYADESRQCPGCAKGGQHLRRRPIDGYFSPLRGVEKRSPYGGCYR